MSISFSGASDNVFQRAQYTAVISDLHLCEAEPLNPKFPLWKKYKTAQFFFDDQFEMFLEHLSIESKGSPVELILNGDIFDFDSVSSLPEHPEFNIEWIEKKRGLYPRPERAKYKIELILKHHSRWTDALALFLAKGNRVVFVIGNHDLELHYPEVQNAILETLRLSTSEKKRVRFCEWFYVSNDDTLIEHGNQYDPYCTCEDPINPYVQGYNFKMIRLPFGNLACRYILNGMGFFNPHVESNFIMSLSEYVKFFFKYMMKAQPTLMFDWLFGATLTLHKSFFERLMPQIRDPLMIEDKINQIAYRANTTPRTVRELRELFAPPASFNPFQIARELWLDRAFFVMVSFFIIFQIMIFIQQFYNVSFFWAFIPLFLLIPFFIFYSRSVTSHVSSYKEPDERTLNMTGAIAKVQRVIYGHTHIPRHEMIGAVEHLNSGCWSPAFTDVECTKAVDQKTYVWITPDQEGNRKARLLKFIDGKSVDLFRSRVQ